jgi:hypothetical protein
MIYEHCPLPLDVTASLRAHVGIPEGVRITLAIAPEDMPVRGNASAWAEGGEALAHDAEVEARLARGDLWAWCIVRVTCTDGDATGTAFIGGSQYEGTEDFIKYGYLQDLAAEAYAEYLGEVERMRAKYAA